MYKRHPPASQSAVPETIPQLSLLFTTQKYPANRNSNASQLINRASIQPHTMSGTFQRLQESLADAKRSASQTINDVTTTNEKTIEMWPNTVDIKKKEHRMTTDAGVGIQDTDHWLKVVGEDGKNGPSLLEDQIAREKITRCEKTCSTQFGFC